MKTPRAQKKDSGYLDGQLLLAMPSMSDKRFRRSVIYLCTHSADGAMGLIVNQRAPDITFTGLLKQLGIVGDDADETVPPDLLRMGVYVGGPVSTERGFVLHSKDYFAQDSTLEIDKGVCLTATIDILKAMASGKGPEQSILALGYAGWAPGQLETEIQGNGWLTVPFSRELLFGLPIENRYDAALASLGITRATLSATAGHG
jgi:putative transcriptional regulator